MTQHFGDRLAAALARHGPLCVGLDPHLARIPAIFDAQADPVAGVERFCMAVIARLAGKIGVVKPQIALFERLGPSGLAALAHITEAAREAGMLVLLDAKRGDIASTAQGYVDAYLGPEAWLHADAVTVNPYMGLDAVTPWLDAAEARGRGVIVLVRTSNPGAADFQTLSVDGDLLWMRVARALSPLAAVRRGASGWSSLMAVVGATAPDEARALREILPDVAFLVPGFGAQGAGAAEALAGGVAQGEHLAGVVVNASRAALFPQTCETATDRAAWTAAFDASLEALRAEVNDAARRAAASA